MQEQSPLLAPPRFEALPWEPPRRTGSATGAPQWLRPPSQRKALDGPSSKNKRCQQRRQSAEVLSVAKVEIEPFHDCGWFGSRDFNTVQHGNVPPRFSRAKNVFGGLFAVCFSRFSGPVFGECNRKHSANIWFAPRDSPPGPSRPRFLWLQL